MAPAFVICFRESVEGTVIVAVLLNMLFKANLPHMKKWVWVGAFIGTGAFALLGAIAIIVWYQIKKTVPTAHRAAFEGVFAALKELYPNMPVAQMENMDYASGVPGKARKIESRAASELGVQFTPFTQALKDSVDSMIEHKALAVAPVA